MLTQSKIKLIFVIVAFVFMVNECSQKCCQQKKQFFSLERPKIVYYDREHLENVSFSSKRIGRKDFNHYLNITAYLKKTWQNDVTHSFYFYQLLSNVYKRSFVEFSFGTCDLLDTDNMIAILVKNSYSRIPLTERPMPTLKCPIKPGLYRFEYAEVPTNYIPKNFPFHAGRVFYNITLGKMPIAYSYIDLEVKTIVD